MATITSDPGALQPDTRFYKVRVDNVTTSTANTYSFETYTSSGSGIVASTVTILGSFSYPGGLISGTVAQVLMDTDADGITDFTIAYPAAVSGILDALVSGDTDAFFGAAFFQNDTITLGGSSQSNVHSFYLGGDGPESDDDVTITGFGSYGGDATRGEGKTGGDDDFLVNSTDPTQNITISGDFGYIGAGSANGGNDTIEDITAAGNGRVFFSGDNEYMYGTTLNGGDDLLIANNRRSAMWGDVNQIYSDGAVLNGGNDTLLGGSGNDYLYGDYGYTLDTPSNTYTINGGNDSIVGGAGNDLIYGEGPATGGVVIETDGNDTLRGGDGNDTIFGGSGDDYMFGDAGDDLLHAGAGTDVFVGGAGTDTLDFSSSFFALTAVLADGSGVGSAISDGVNEQVYQIENIIGTNLADDLTGNSDSNTFEGGGGNDTLEGGAGLDIANYANAAAGITVDLSIADGTGQTIGGGQGIDTLISIEGVIGSAHNDTIFGDDTNDSIDGGAGDDILLMRSGLEGFAQPGTDTINGGSGDDTIGYSLDGLGQANFGGVHQLDGGWNTAVGDTFVFETFGGSYVVVLDAYGDGTFASSVGAVLRANLTGFENVSAGEGSDIITVHGGTVYGNGGNDVLTAITSSSFLEGGAGNDTLVGASNGGTLNGGADDDLIDATLDENADHQIDGGTGNDRFLMADMAATSAALGDTVDGGIDTDTAVYETWSDSYVVSETGGVVTFSDASTPTAATTFSGVEVYELGGLSFTQAELLSTNFAFGTSLDDTVTGTAGNDVISDDDVFNVLLNRVSGDDVLRGYDGDDIILASGGDDDAYDGLGDDVVILGDGDDYVRVGGGVDSFDGGQGDDDYISYYDSTGGINLDLETNAASGSWASNDTIANFESAGGSKTGDDTISGTASANRIKTYGGDDDVYDRAGDDIVELGSGNDYVRVGGGADSYDGGSGTDDYISYYDSVDGVTLDLEANTASGGEAADDTISGFESAGGSKDGDDTISGTSGANRIKTYGGDDDVYDRAGDDIVELGSGNDYVRVGGGADSYDGGSGKDYISYYDSVDGVTLDLEANTASGGEADDDTVNGFESMSGSKDGADRVSGTSGSNTIKTYGGDDKVYDRGGNDLVALGDGDDYVRVGGGKDSYDGGDGTDDYISYYDSTAGVTLDLEANTAAGSWASNDTIANFESAGGSKTGDDVIYGTSGANRIKTYGGDDDVYDRGGNDIVELGSGDDYVRVGGGVDSYNGGSGKDYISYFDSTGGVTLDLETNTAAGSWASNDTVLNFESASGSNVGADKILGTSGSNTIKTYGGDDSLYGRSGDDKLYGGKGQDRFDGGGGDDLLYGGADADQFHFDRGEGNDTIKDFENNIDVIEFDNFGYLTTAADALGFASEISGDVFFDFGADGTVLVENATMAQLTNYIDIV
ncbi:calcium-binding protein [Rhodobacteraceae bacterium KMM 6894]|nr:calcium-binding protein [Rhodobacteraceae bacterium KMM 6894]